MKITILLFVALLAYTCVADQSKFQSQLTSLMNMQARATDAVDSALQLLNDLKQANVDAQARADEVNRSQEESLGRQIQQLQALVDQNKAIGDEATEHRKWLQSEIETTQQNLVWITKRKAEIARQREEFRNHRCYASFMFVKSLREHDEAIKVVQWLREDILGVIADHSEESASFAEITDSASKLKAYAHLFDKQAMKAFNQLTQNEAQAVDAETAEWDSNADDNSQGGLELQRMGAGTEDRDVGQKLLDAVNRLEEHLVNSMADLKQNEIKAAWDLVRWLQGTEEELRQLDVDQATLELKMDNLLIAVVGAKAREDEVWQVYFESVATLNGAHADREAKRQWYAQEVARRNEENNLLDEVIRIFLERVSQLDGGLRAKVDDFSVDGVFNENNDIRRRTDANLERDLGRVGSNTDSQARA